MAAASSSPETAPDPVIDISLLIEVNEQVLISIVTVAGQIKAFAKVE